MKRLVAAASAITFGVVITAHAYSAIVSLEDLVNKSELVVLAHVVTVRDSAVGAERQQTATAIVDEWWKGAGRSNQIEYVASPGWFACDVSAPKIGETVVLFLERDPNDRRLHITHFGRGRMPVGRERSELYAAPYEVTFPREIKVERQQNYPRAKIVMVSSLRNAVRAR